MSEQPNPFDVRNAGKPWSDNDVARLRNLANGSQPMRLIVRDLGRPEEEITAKAEELGITFGSRYFDRLAYLEGRDPTAGTS